MAKAPFTGRRRTLGVHDAAEAVFKPKVEVPELAPEVVVVPGARELVSLRLDQDVLAHFQEDGAGWQDRINLALRQAAGL